MEAFAQVAQSRSGQLETEPHTQFLGDFAQPEQEHDSHESRLRLWAARRQLSTEIILVINELYIEFFTSAVTIVFGIDFRSSGPLSRRLSSTELSWDMLPMFVATTHGPEVLEAVLIVIYLRHVGVDCFGLCKDMLTDRNSVLLKVGSMLGCLIGLILSGID